VLRSEWLPSQVLDSAIAEAIISAVGPRILNSHTLEARIAALDAKLG
jgi:hypothetical protein